MRISQEKLILAGVSAGIVALDLGLDLFVFATSHSILGSLWLALIGSVGGALMIFAFFAEKIIPYNRSDERLAANTVIILPLISLLLVQPLIRALDLGAAARIARFGIHEYESKSDARQSFNGLLRFRNARINAEKSVYYPPDEDFSGEIYYALEDLEGNFLGVFIDSFYRMQQRFIDSINEDSRLHRPLGGFIARESHELDRCNDVLTEGAIKFNWQDSENALCLIYVPVLPDFAVHSRWALRLLLPLVILSHFLVCLIILRKVR